MLGFKFKMLNYKSKEGQDKWVVKMIGEKRDGFFVDIGAANGIIHSNSYVFEKDLNWKGICVEPNPTSRAYPLLIRNRSCFCENSCIYKKNGVVPFVPRGYHAESSGIYYKESSESILYQVEQKKHPLIEVPSITLMKLLKKYNLNHWVRYSNAIPR